MPLDILIYLVICFVAAGLVKQVARFAAEYDAQVPDNARRRELH